MAILALCLLVTAGASSGQSASPRKYDEFAEYNCEDMMARLDNYAMAVQSEPKMRAYVVSYGGSWKTFIEARMWAVAARIYLTTNRGIKNKRVVTLYGGERSRKALELWLVPDDYRPSAAQGAGPKGTKFKRVRLRSRPCEFFY
ncbi:MAG TPA: hypothetical protein VJT74_07690 [Pyrinomonadaceae bacterium]|nr:hypothetical protein [Pyrinomonadaceae bacterium]